MRKIKTLEKNIATNDTEKLDIATNDAKKLEIYNKKLEETHRAIKI